MLQTSLIQDHKTKVLYLHETVHGVLDLFHGWSQAGFLVPAAGHQRLYRLWKVFDQWRPCT